MQQRVRLRTRPWSSMMIGTNLFLIAAGAILKYAVTLTVIGIDLRTVGVILMIVGIVGLAVNVVLLLRTGDGETPSPTAGL